MLVSRSWTRRARSGVAVVISVMGLALTGCVVAPPPEPPRTVLVFGDSITWLGSDTLTQRIGSDGRYKVMADGIWGATIGARLPDGPRFAAMGHEIVVINLGTNDAWSSDADDPPTSPSLASQELRELVANFHACIVLVEVHRGTPIAGRIDGQTAAAINTTDVSITPRVVRWDAAANTPGVLADDGVHPSTKGQELLADLMRTQLDACPR